MLLLFSMLLSLASGASCAAISDIAVAAQIGDLAEDQRQCLHRMARRGGHQEEASRLLLVDADARGEDWMWLTLAEIHVKRVPGDAGVWDALVTRAWSKGDAANVVRLTNLALAVQREWADDEHDPLVGKMLRLRTYAALKLRDGRGIDDTVVGYARAWLAVSSGEDDAALRQIAGGR